MLPEQLFRSTFDASPIGQYILAPTEKLEILAVNDAFLLAVSRSRAEVEGRPLFEVFPNDPSDPDAQGRQSLAQSIARAIDTRTSQVMPAQRYPIEMNRHGRTWFEDMYWSATNTPIYDESGTLACISHTTIDITARVKSEQLLRESEERSRAYILATSDVLYRMSPDWSHMHQLDGRGFLKTTTEWAEYRIEEYVHPDDVACARSAIEQAISSKGTFELEHRVLRADGSHGWTYSRAVPRLDASGNVYEWIGAASDITVRKQVEEKLKEADRRKDEFLAMLAHELRNPLAPIGSAAEVLRRGTSNEAVAKRVSEVIHRQVRHMTGLIDDLLDVSRVTRGKVTLQEEPVELGQVISDAIEQVTSLVQAKHHQLTVELNPEPTQVRGDRKRLVQVFANLLNNAAKYTPQSGSILIAMEVRQDHVLVQVSDNGIGIPASLNAKVFDLFTQADRSSDRSEGGLGLGLALVKSLVELHRGSVSCESRGLGLGSTFTVQLPRLAGNVAAAELPLQPSRAAVTTPLRILVVDDNVDAASLLAMLLQDTGHTVMVEHTAPRALGLALAQRPDACLLDIGLQDMDGYELARRLREHPHTARSILIAVTGYGQESDRTKAMEAGFDDYLVKPVDGARLMSALASASLRRSNTRT